MTPTQISLLAQKMLDRFPARGGSAEQQQNDDIRTRQVIIEELGFYFAAQSPDLREIVRVHVCKMLEMHGWNRTRAAVSLGLSTKTVLNLITKYRKAGHVIPPWNGNYRG